ncbi:MAG: HD domain-containing protein [Polyangiaceae bacterium]|nr:HD domain-containing protein [Polyangiaceae bacterium]
MLLRDPVHGLIAFESAESALLPRLLETAEVQRLRRIKQLGLASLAYPGADHTRFSHAIGTAHVMQRLVERLRALHGELPYWQRLTSERAREALVAALLHDLGHGPFSHLFEEALPDGPRHEEWTRRVLLDDGTEVGRSLREVDPALPARVAELVHGRHELGYLARAVSGTFDVDRSDYLLRDAHFTGVSYGRFDLDWLLRSFRFGDAPETEGGPGLAIDGAKGLPAIESFVLARLFMFQQVYFHKAGRAAEQMITRILARVRVLLLDGQRLPGVPPAIATLAMTGDCSLGTYLELDDAVLSVALRAWQDAPDPILADLARRMNRRRLFKTHELLGEQREPEARQRALERARDVARGHGLAPEHYVGLDVAEDVPFAGEDEPLTVILGGGRRARPSEVSFLLARLQSERLRRVRLVFAPEIREAVVAAVEADAPHGAVT